MQISPSGNDAISRLIALDASVAQTKSQIGAVIAGKQLQTQKQQGAAIVDLIQQSVPNGGIDIQA